MAGGVVAREDDPEVEAIEGVEVAVRIQVPFQRPGLEVSIWASLVVDGTVRLVSVCVLRRAWSCGW